MSDRVRQNSYPPVLKLVYRLMRTEHSQVAVRVHTRTVTPVGTSDHHFSRTHKSNTAVVTIVLLNANRQKTPIVDLLPLFHRQIQTAHRRVLEVDEIAPIHVPHEISLLPDGRISRPEHVGLSMAPMMPRPAHRRSTRRQEGGRHVRVRQRGGGRSRAPAGRRAGAPAASRRPPGGTASSRATTNPDLAA